VLEVGKHSSGITLKFQANVPIAQAQQKYHEVNSIIYIYVYHSSCLPAFIAISHAGVHPRVGWEGGCQAAVSTQTKILKKSDSVGTILNIIHDPPFSQNWLPGLSSDIHTIKIRS